MSMQFYVAPEQMMKDRADFARKGIARGRALVAVVFADGIALVAENPSNTLRKISEIYDRIAFAGVGKYNEFDQLRMLGVRQADLTGFQYSRRDVEARSLVNQYAQAIGHEFTSGAKPLEVEILVAQDLGHGFALQAALNVLGQLIHLRHRQHLVVVGQQPGPVLRGLASGPQEQHLGLEPRQALLLQALQPSADGERGAHGADSRSSSCSASRAARKASSTSWSCPSMTAPNLYKVRLMRWSVRRP